jgi:hypothetical protein
MHYNWYKFVCDRSMTKVDLFEEHCTNSAVYRLLLHGSFSKLHTYHSLRMCNNWYKFGCDQSITKRTSLEEQSTFCTVSLLLFQVSFKTPFTHCACTTIGISLVAVSKYRRTFYLKNVLQTPLYLAFYSMDLSKTIKFHSLCVRYNWFKFGCDRSITKGTLLEEQSTFSIVSLLLFHGSP